MKIQQYSGLGLAVSLMGISALAPVPGYGEWHPRPINPALCNSAEFEPSRPPEGGSCDIEVRLKRTEFANGQGVSEGKGEFSIDFTAESFNPASMAAFRYPDSGEAIYSVGETKGHNTLFDTYSVPVNQSLDVDVCAKFIEHDGGGGNGQDDIGEECVHLVLRCDPSDGQPTYQRTIGPTQLCGPNQCNGSMSATVEVIRSDADGDGVINPEDVTPEPCDEERKGKEGIGLLLYFNYNDNPLITLAQTAGANLSLIYGAYDYVALVTDSGTSNPLGLNGAAISGADVVFPPTQEGLLDAIRDLTSQGLRFDTFVHAHGYKNGSDDSEFETLVEDERISGDWLLGAMEPDVIGTAKGGIPIVAWWSTTCIAERQIDAWHEIGAVATNGAPDVQFFPQTWANFATSWTTGDRYRDAVDNSLTNSIVTASAFLIDIQGLGWGCLPPDTPDGVTGPSTPCSIDFFNNDDGSGPDQAQYAIQDVYDAALTGLDNMLVSSERFFIGDDQIRFAAPSVPSWP